MGGSSTSHTAVLRAKKDSSSSAFDLHSWQGLTLVLKEGKESLKDSSAYGEFRDLVLQYAQQGGDVELRKKIDAIIATFGQQKEVIIPVTPPSIDIPQKIVVQTESVVKPITAPEKKEEPTIETLTPLITIPDTHAVSTPQTRDGFIQRRPQPQFKVAQHTAVPEDDSHIAVATPVLPSEVQTPAPTPEKEVPTVPLTPTHPVTVPSFLPKEENLTTTSAVAEEKQMAVPKTVDEYRARIAEIKRTVHSFVGNPAALMDTHNELGKKYMSALLSALKATGGGSNLDVDHEMQKLEDATTLLLAEKKEGKSDNPHAVSKIVPEATVVEKVEQVIPVVEPPVTEMRTVVPEVSAPVPPKEIVIEDEPEVPEPKIVEPEPEVLKVKIVEPEPVGEKEEVVVPKEDIEVPVPEPTPAPVVEPPLTTEVVHAPKHIDAIPEKIDIVRTTQPLQQAELATPEITQALHQLLHEWSIFDGSGFLGIGPGGSDHPLYKKLAPLSMGEVIAGRWEESDPKITKNIKQYVDAWRHEQGIAYTINETFEHYLRRVVQRILKRQI